MFDKVIKYAELNKMFHKCRGIVAGLSGGADSVCLLHILKRLQAIYGFELVAVHVHHGIRGVEADNDAAYCQKICEKWEIPLEIYYYDIPKIAEEEHLTEEEAGRIIRYKCFEESAEEGYRIAVAHHMNDQAETVLFNICRGSGVKGTGGIQPVRNRIIRPLLNCSRTEIENYLSEKGIAYCEDSTNNNTDYSRNVLRNLVIPMLVEKINSKAVENISLMAERIRESEIYLEKLTEQRYMACVSYRNGMILLKRLENEDEYMIKRLIRKAVAEMNSSLKDVGAVHLERVLQLTGSQRGSRCNIRNGLWAERTREGILFYKESSILKKTPVDINPPCEIIPWNNSGKFTFKVIEWNSDKKISNELYTKCFDYDRIKFGLQLRTWQSGDIITIDDSGHHKTIKQYFVDTGVSRVDKDNTILLADGNCIMWVVGGRIGADYKISNSTRMVLEVNYGGELNGES